MTARWLFLFLLLLANSTWGQIELPASPCISAGIFEQKKSLQGLVEPIYSDGAFYFHCEYGVIWATKSPISETLILKRNGKGTLLTEQGQQKLASQQSKFLGELLNNLIGGDTQAIQKQFTIESINNEEQEYRLIPKKRRLKRALKYLTLTLSAEDNPDKESLSSPTARIDIVDRNDQQTHIKSTRTATFEHPNAAHEQCLTVSDIPTAACQELLNQ